MIGYMAPQHVEVARLCYALGPRVGDGVIVAEQRNPTLDHKLELAWLNLKVSGTAQVRATQIERKFRRAGRGTYLGPGLVVLPKQ